MNGSSAPLHDAAVPPRAPLPAGITLDDHTLALTGEVDRATATNARRVLPAARLAEVDTIDLSHATYLDAEAVHLLLRCLRARQQRAPSGPAAPAAPAATPGIPGSRLHVKGANHRLRENLKHLGLLPLVDLSPASYSSATGRHGDRRSLPPTSG